MSKKERKPFGQTKVGKLLKNVGSPVLDLVGNVVPGADILSNVIDAVVKDDTIEPKTKEEILKELDFELELAQVEAADRASARQREIELKKAGGSNWFQYVVGIAVLVGYGAVVYVALWEEVNSNELFYFIAGNVFAFGASIVSYYYGSSTGSKQKDILKELK